MIFYYAVILMCLIGMYKGVKAYFACIKADALKAAFNMMLITLLFFSILGITLYIGSHYMIIKNFTL